jgi:arginyl-tRNA synthetase
VIPVTIIHSAVERSLTGILSDIGLGALPARLVPCPRPELGDAAVQAPLAGARILKRPPLAIATEIAERLAGLPELASAEAVAPGFVNLRFSDAAIAAALEAQAADPACGVSPVPNPERIVIDFGGPNVGKSMHVGHLRAFVLGESLRRILSAVGHTVISDIHFGDWGLPAGMILDALALDGRGAAWLAPGSAAPYPEGCPIGPGDLVTLYPDAAAACKADEARMASARAMTASLQAGEPGPTALWTAIREVAKEAALVHSDRLGARFDLLLGEADAQPGIPAMLAAMEASGVARRDGEAILVDLAEDSDAKAMPPLVLAKGDGSSLYATSDLATIVQRVRDLAPTRMVYVVDQRQSLHFAQVFRAAAKAGIAPGVAFEHLGFGTVNGPDGKPFRTRDGGAVALGDLLDAARAKAESALRDAPGLDRDVAAERIGIAALKVADLSSHRLTGYALDLDRILQFEGRTGPYLLYALVRLRSVLTKVEGASGSVTLAHSAERELALTCLGYDLALKQASIARAPHDLIGYAFDLAGALGRFYVSCPVLSEPNVVLRGSRISICRVAEATMAQIYEVIGLDAPNAM